MKNINTNFIRSSFSSRHLAIFLLIASLFCASAKSLNAQDQTAVSLYGGTWEYNDNENSLAYVLEFSRAGEIIMRRYGYFDVESDYTGTYSVQSNSGDYTFSVKTSWDDDNNTVFNGNFSATIDNSGMLHFTLKTALPSFGECGESRVFHKRGAAIPAELPATPNVLDFFKAAYPLTFNYTITCSYNFILFGKGCFSDDSQQDPWDKKTVDLTNGYIHYLTGGTPPSAVECCYWRCNDGTCLFAINEMGESPDILPTMSISFFRFDLKRKVVQKVDPPFALNSPKDGNWSLQLPRRGKNIKVIYLNENYEERSSRILKWDGSRFTAEL